MRLLLVKYEGLGNDFLVLIDPERAVPFGAADAAALCDRHTGVGADGLLRLSAPSTAGAGGERLRMELRNADGGLAETSGNGLRCAALAAVHAGLVRGEQLVLETAGADSDAEVTLGPGGTAEVRVGMGRLAVGVEEASPLAGRWARRVDVGNPHLVCYSGDPVAGAPGLVDLASVGPAVEAATPGGVNLEVVAPSPDGEGLVLTVWERGAGATLACGSGSCAAAAAARAAGRTGDSVRVRNPGGSLLVELSGPAERPTARLTGPARRVARIEVDLADLAVLEAVRG